MEFYLKAAVNVSIYEIHLYALVIYDINQIAFKNKRTVLVTVALYT